MSILQKLTLRHLAMNRKRTAITVIGIVLSVAMVTAVSGMVASTQDLLYRESILDGLWHVRYSNVPGGIVEQVVQEPVFSQWELVETEAGPVLSLEFARLHKGVFDESEAVCLKYGIEMEQVRYNNNLLIAEGILPGPYNRALYTFAGILMGLIAIGSVLVISNAFAISSDQRSLQFGLLKSAGATRDQIRGMVLFEGAALAVVAIPLGILVGFFAQWVALSIANAILRPMVVVTLESLFEVVISPLALLVTVLSALVTIFFAAWFPAQRASKVSAIEAIRQTASIKILPRQVRVSPLVGRAFGFEGLLAAKAMGRNRGKYRATILALVVSIVLYIGVSSFGDILVKATSMVYTDYGSNVAVTLGSGTAQQHNRLAAEIAFWEGVQVYPSRNITGEAALPQDALGKEYLQYFTPDAPTLHLFSIGEEEYSKLRRSLQLKESPTVDSGFGGILVNDSGIYIHQGRRVNFVPFRMSAGDIVPVTVNGRQMQLHLDGITQQVPTGIAVHLNAASFNVIVSDAEMEDLWPQEEDFLWLNVMAEDADAFEERALAFLEALPYHSWSVVNYEKMVANNRNIYALVMIFVYGFVAMLTLIGITSIITTISTSIALRAREFAMLRSVGMTERAIAKMLNYESLLYGIKALLWGIPLGLVASLLLYRAMTSVMDFPFIWPLGSIAISIVVVLLLTFATMAFARRKQRRINIVEALRVDII